jgi:hypothetical protein
MPGSLRKAVHPSKENGVWDMVVTLLNVRVVAILLKGGIVMIPLLPYNWFRAKVEQLTDLVEERATRLELLLCKRED